MMRSAPRDRDVLFSTTDEYDMDDDDPLNKLPLLSQGTRNSNWPSRRRISAWLWSRPRYVLRALGRPSRSPLRLLRKLLQYTLYLFLLALVVTPIFFPSYTRRPAHYEDLRLRCAVPTPAAGCANPHGEKIFISVSLFDPRGDIAGGAWGAAVLALIHLVGPQNAYLSIYENDSGERGAAALRGLESRLAEAAPACGRSLYSVAHVDYADFPHITMPDGERRLKRLAYLSEMRNRALGPLDWLRRGAEGVELERGEVDEDDVAADARYDKILFLNDAVFDPLDAAHLLFSTNVGPDGRTHYLAACGMDYDKDPFRLYDVYAQRDADGYSMGLPIFPYFSASGSARSRKAMLAQRDAVPVRSCWGSTVAVQARWVQNVVGNGTMPDPRWRELGRHVVVPEAPRFVTAPVRFRYEPEVYFDACECCLFMADLAAVAGRAAGKQKEEELGIYVNPFVRVAYASEMLRWERLARRWERLWALPQRIITWVVGLPTHNPHREVAEGRKFEEEVFSVGQGKWEMVTRWGRSGMFCGVREMQLITEGPRGEGMRNWENVEVPWRSQRLDFPP